MNTSNTNDLNAKNILTIEETIAYTTLSRSTIDRAFYTGKLKKTRLSGKRIGIKRTDLDAYLQNLNA